MGGKCESGKKLPPEGRSKKGGFRKNEGENMRHYEWNGPT